MARPHTMSLRGRTPCLHPRAAAADDEGGGAGEGHQCVPIPSHETDNRQCNLKLCSLPALTFWVSPSLRSGRALRAARAESSPFRLLPANPTLVVRTTERSINASLHYNASGRHRALNNAPMISAKEQAYFDPAPALRRLSAMISRRPRRSLWIRLGNVVD